jgi:anti-sigma factor ChrR (cupin superfamily)
MRINDDLTQPVIVHAAKLDWIPSPVAGVDRRMLFRIGDEVARATSIVRYAPGTAFPRHTHSGGEEIVVLDGTFQDEHGNYPAGSYFRNPPGTSHIPASEDGCIIFVRLWQFREDDQAQLVRRPGEGEEVEPREGATAARVLFDDGHERVCFEDWTAGETLTVGNERGLEFLVLSGEIVVGEEKLEPQGWGRLPAGLVLNATVGPRGARIWIKEAPSLHQDACQLPI